MISSQKLQTTYKDVPASWIFEFYCRLGDKLTGEKMRIKSLFNSNDSDPSMFIYFDKGKGNFRFKDFSSGKGGDALDLVRYLTGKNYREAERQIVDDYFRFCDSNGTYQPASVNYQYSAYAVTEYKKRAWTKDDAPMWTPFNIGSRLLEHYCVAPLEYYIMTRQGNPPIVVKNAYLYGYFTKEGKLYKIYQPRNFERKFIKVESWVKDYLQGSDQLMGHDLLVIVSSMKEILTIKSFRLKVDLVAPDSENTLLTEEQIDRFRDRYPFMAVMLDNDNAGVEAMMRYRDLYGLPPVLLPMSKDVSDSVRDFSPRKVCSRLIPLFNNAIEHYAVAA